MVPGASDDCTLLPTPLGTPTLFSTVITSQTYIFTLNLSPVPTAAVSLPSSSPALGGGHGIGSSSFLHCHDNPPAGKAVDANPCRSNCCDINPQKIMINRYGWPAHGCGTFPDHGGSWLNVPIR